MPIGSELAADIARKLDIRFSDGLHMDGHGDQQIYDAVKRSLGPGEKANEYLYACWAIRDRIELANSIDNFLDVYRRDQKINLCGKVALSKIILDKEKSSKLKFDPHEQTSWSYSSLSETWLVALFRILQNDTDRDSPHLLFRNVSFVVFNYDRCIEQFFYHAVQSYYGISADAAAAIVSRVPIHHPYGTVGRLPWQMGQSSSEHAKVGFGNSGGDLIASAAGIRTFTESVDSELHKAVLEAIDFAETIVFLGMSYGDQNLDLLSKGKKEPGARRIYGTGVGLSEADRLLVGRRLRSLMADEGADSDVTIRDLFCERLISEYARSIASG